MAPQHVHSLRRAEVDAGYCSIETVSLPSDDHKYNEDRVTWLFTSYGVIIAIFDGHYGRATSEYAKNHLLNHIHERVSHDIVRNNLDDVESTLRTAVMDFDGALIGDILQKLQVFASSKSLPLSNWSMDHDTQDFLGMKEDGENDPYAVYRRAAEGTTILLSLLVKQDSGYEAWTISLGDSDGFTIHCDHTATIISEQHNATNPKEVDRLIEEHPDDPDTVLHSRVKGHLAVTRALGNATLKVDLPYAHALSCMWGMPIHFTMVDDWTNHTPPYILSNPAIKRHQVCNTDFLVFASDGLRLAMETSSTELGNVISHIAGESNNSGLASRVMDEARRRARDRLADDVTILVFRVGKV